MHKRRFCPAWLLEKGSLESADSVDAISLHQWAWWIFGGRGLWRWPFLVEAALGLAEEAGFRSRRRRFLRTQILADSGANFGGFGGLGLVGTIEQRC